MYYLNNLKNLRFYKVRLGHIEKVKDKKRDYAFLYVNETLDQFINFLNSDFIYKTYFSSVYVPRKINSSYNNKMQLNNQKEIYTKLRERCPSIVKTKRDLSAYRSFNLIADTSTEYELLNKTCKATGTKKVKFFIKLLENKIQELKKYYKKVVLVVNMDENIINGDVTKHFSLVNANSPLTLLFNMYRKRMENNIGNDVELVFHSSEQNTFFKIDFLLNSNNKPIKVTNITKKILTFSKKINNIPLDDIEEEKEEIEVIEYKKDDKQQVIANKVTEKLITPLGIKGDKPLSSTSKDIVEKIKMKINDKIEDKIDEKKRLNSVSNNNLDNTSSDENDENIDEDELIDSIINELEEDEEFKKDYIELKDIEKVGSENNKKKDEHIKKLKDRQSEIKINELEDLTFDDIINDFKSVSIEETEIPVNSLNKNIKSSKLIDFDKSYQAKQMDKDLASIVSAFNNDPDVKLFLTDFKKEDTSTDLDKKHTLTFKFEDENKVKHTIKLDMPKIDSGKFLHLNGGRKLILKQIMLLPIVKTKIDTVQVSTNYNKFFIMRFGQKLNNKTEMLKKILTTDIDIYKVENKKFNIMLGNALTMNNSFDLNLEYNDFSSFLLKIETNNEKILFDYSKINKLISDNSMDFDKKLYDNVKDLNMNVFFILGYDNSKNPILVDKTNGKVGMLNGDNFIELAPTISDYIINLSINNLAGIEEEFKKIKSPKSLAYNRVKINNKLIPLIVLLGYELGLKNTLDRYKLKYEFSQSNKKIKYNDNVRKIRFKDGYLFYDTSKLRYSLLLNGLSLIDTENYNFKDMDTIYPYLEYFYTAFGSRNIGKGIHNTLTLMLDPITLDVLKSLKLPENIYDILLYANTLLEDSSYKKLNDMSVYRIRGAEQVNAMLYKIIADSFKTYKDTAKSGHPIVMSLPQDYLIKKLLEMNTVDEYSVLNPSLE